MTAYSDALKRIQTYSRFVRFNQIQAYSTLLSGMSEVGHDEVDLVLIVGLCLGRELDVGQLLQDVADAALLAELLGQFLLLGLRHVLVGMK